MAIITFGTGHELLSFIKMTEPCVPGVDRDIPMTWSMVVLMYQDKYVLMYNRNRFGWEVPGGGIEDGETPDDAARREVLEETCQVVETVTCQGIFKIRLQPSGKLEYGVLYTASIDKLLPFVENNESTAIMLWEYGADVEETFGILGRYVIDLTRE